MTAGGLRGSTLICPCLVGGSVLTSTRTSLARNLRTLGTSRVNTNTTWEERILIGLVHFKSEDRFKALLTPALGAFNWFFMALTERKNSNLSLEHKQGSYKETNNENYLDNSIDFHVHN